MIPSIRSSVAAPTAPVSAPAAKPIDVQISNFNTGISAEQKGNSVVLSGVPAAPRNSFGGMLNLKLNKGSNEMFDAGVYVPVGKAPTLKQAADQLAEQVTANTDFKATVTAHKDGTISIDLARKPADVAKLDAAIRAALHTGRVDNFIDTDEAKAIVAVAKQDGGISNNERWDLSNLLNGWTYNSDDLHGASPVFEKPTLSITAGGEIQKELWPTV